VIEFCLDVGKHDGISRHVVRFVLFFENFDQTCLMRHCRH